RQITSVQLQTSEGNVRLVAIYLPPSKTWVQSEFESLLAEFGSKFIAGGDYNAKHAWWENSRACRKGKLLQEVIANGHYQVLSTGEPTFYSYNPLLTPTALDFCIINGYAIDRLQVRTIHELSSDHTPIMATLHATPERKPQRSRLLARGANLNAFKVHLEQLSEVSIEIQEPSDIDNAISLFMRMINQAAELAAPSNHQHTDTSIHPQLPPRIAEVFANNLEQRFKPYEYSPDSIRRQVEEFLESPFQMSLPANPVSL
ncbi:hypothetical protein KR026_004255, partial [Drosophila bipectinata]